VCFSDFNHQTSFDFLNNIDILISGDSNIHLEATLLNIYSIYFDPHGTKLDWYGFHKNDLIPYYSETEKLFSDLSFLIKNRPDVRYKAKIFCDNIQTQYDGNSNFLITSVLNNYDLNSVFFENKDKNNNSIFSLTNYDLKVFNEDSFNFRS
jgi:hypothetical protein